MKENSHVMTNLSKSWIVAEVATGSTLLRSAATSLLARRTLATCDSFVKLAEALFKSEETFGKGAASEDGRQQDCR